MYRADALENSVWEEVRKLLSEPESVLRQYDEYIERQRRLMRGNPEEEARDLIERLQKIERRRSRYIDLAADRDISREELRAKLAEVDVQREAVQKALRDVRDRQETIRRLEQDSKMWKTALWQYFMMRSVGLTYLDPENRRRVFQALNPRVEVDKDGDVHISGVFDVDITKLLVIPPMWDPACGTVYTQLEHEIPSPFRGNIPVDNTQRPVPKTPEVTRMVDTPYRSSTWTAWRPERSSTPTT